MCPPKAEVTGSNPVGCAIKISYLQQYPIDTSFAGVTTVSPQRAYW